MDLRVYTYLLTYVLTFCVGIENCRKITFQFASCGADAEESWSAKHGRDVNALRENDSQHTSAKHDRYGHVENRRNNVTAEPNIYCCSNKFVADQSDGNAVQAS